jgi:hypothetical protein
MDCRVKPGNDFEWVIANATWYEAKAGEPALRAGTGLTFPNFDGEGDAIAAK